MAQLNWKTLDGDGPATVVAYDDNHNELFYAYKLEPHDQWEANVVRDKQIASERVPGVYPDHESAEEICEKIHELADINHQYNE